MKQPKLPTSAGPQQQGKAQQQQPTSTAAFELVPPSLESLDKIQAYMHKVEHKDKNRKGGKYSFAGPTVHDRLALTMMIKNEEKRIEVSFDSVKDICRTFVILDTGSTDRTLDVVRSYCAQHNITLHLRETPFVNFEKSRNDLLDFADEVLKHHYFLLLFDCNDELRNKDELTKLCEAYKGEATGFYLRQQWWTGRSLDNYFNTRMVLSHFGWRYHGVVHEVIMRSNDVNYILHNDIFRCENIILFQDRTHDDDKTMKRFRRDKDLLYTAYMQCPTEPRTLFYLAQTCGCLNQHQEAYNYYMLRLKYQGFGEEIYQSYYRLGNLARQLGHPWEEAQMFYLKAYAAGRRAEPLVALAEYYKDNNTLGEKKPDWHMAYMFAKQACSLAYPHQQSLFIDKNVYLYKRWNLMGIIAYYVNRYKEGKDACIKALMAKDEDIDWKNIKFYLEAEKKVNHVHKHGLDVGGIDPFVYVSTSTEMDDLYSSKEAGLSIGTARTREDVLKKVVEKYK
jgi:glycosyltransferase involved in cell wall biosynthesis